MDEHDYITIIHRDLMGEASADDLARLAEWRTTDAEHPAIEAEIRRAWELSADYEPAVQVDTEAQLARLKTRIRAAPTRQRKQATGRRFSAWAAAAAAVLLVAIGVWWQSASRQDAEYITAFAKTDGEVVELADGSEVVLRAGSRLEYPSAYAKTGRTVRLTGEAYFNVTKGKTPFTVRLSDETSVEVLGTRFVVDAAGPDGVTTTVYEGRVRMRAGEEAVVLVGGEQASFRQNTGSLRTEPFQRDALDWRRADLSFRDQPLSQVLAELEATFGQRFELANGALADCPFGGNFPAADGATVATAIAAVFGLQIKTSELGYRLTGGTGCE